MAFNTGNALGSTDPRDLSDNAENLDRFANGTDPAYNDRLSKSRKSLAGMESDFASDQASRATTFANFLASSGYVGTGTGGAIEDYAGGIEITEYNQIIRESGEFYRAKASLSLPYTTTGTWIGGDETRFVAVGDAALRQEIGSGIFRADSLANLESTNGRFDGDAARLVSGTGRDGDFRWNASDLSSTLVLASATSDSVDSGTDTINDADHPFSDGDGVITQTTVNGLTAQTVYWVVNSTTGTYQLSATFGGGAVDLTGTTNVTIDHLLDPRQRTYVTPTSDKTGASGAWVFNPNGFPDSVAPKYLKTVSDIINGLPIDVMRGIPANLRESIRDYSIASDLSSYIQELDADINDSSGILYFPNGRYNFAGVNKGIYTRWIGAGQGEAGVNNGVVLRPSADDVMVTCDAGGTAKFTNAKIAGFEFRGDFATFPNSEALSFLGGTRQVYFEELYIFDFNYDIRLVGGGEYYLDKVFAARSRRCLLATDIADSWFTRSHFGSGPAWAGNPEGYGVHVTRGDNLSFGDSCRFQVSQLNGGFFDDCNRIQIDTPIIDQNDDHGFVIRDSRHVTVSDPSGFDNGTTSAKRAAIAIVSTAGNAVEDVSIIGGHLFDRNTGTGSERQERGVQYINSGTMDGMSITGVNMKKVANPIRDANVIDGTFHQSNNPGVSDFAFLGDTNKTVDGGTEREIRFNVNLSVNRTVTLSQSGAYSGKTQKVSRTGAGAGTLDLVDDASSSTIKTLAAGEYAQVVYTGSNWVVSESGTI